MTTDRQVKAVVRPLLARHSDLFYVRRTLCIRPVRHFARMVLFDACSSADICVPQWILLNTFLPTVRVASIIGRCSDDLTPPEPRGGLWCWSDPTMAGALAERVDAFALPLLRSLDTFERSLWFGIGHMTQRGTLDPSERVVMDIASGDLDAARRIWGKVGRSYVPGEVLRWTGLQPRYDQYCRIGPLLLADDRPALSKLLHEWEAANMRGSPLEPHWEPTPFPLDAGL